MVKIRVEDVESSKFVYVNLIFSKVKVFLLFMFKYVVLFEKVVFLGKIKENFVGVIDNFFVRNWIRRGYMEFFKIVMNYVEEFDLGKDVEVYNRMLDVFFRGRFDNRILFDVIWVKKYF